MLPLELQSSLILCARQISLHLSLLAKFEKSVKAVATVAVRVESVDATKTFSQWPCQSS